MADKFKCALINNGPHTIVEDLRMLIAIAEMLSPLVLCFKTSHVDSVSLSNALVEVDKTVPDYVFSAPEQCYRLAVNLHIDSLQHQLKNAISERSPCDSKEDAGADTTVLSAIATVSKFINDVDDSTGDAKCLGLRHWPGPGPIAHKQLDIFDSVLQLSVTSLKFGNKPGLETPPLVVARRRAIAFIGASVPSLLDSAARAFFRDILFVVGLANDPSLSPNNRRHQAGYGADPQRNCCTKG